MSPLLEVATTSNSLNIANGTKNARSSPRPTKKGVQKLQELKVLVEQAIQDHKTFTVLGSFACIKNALKLRAWIEKLENRSRNESSSHDGSPVSGASKSSGGSSDDIQISRLLKDYCVDFVWTMKNEPIRWKKLNSKTIVSRFPRADFTTKIGLCNNLQQPHWYYEENISMIFFPRCFNISNEEELAAFNGNFRLTACISLIKYIFEAQVHERNVFSVEGTIPLTAIDFAFQRCKEYIAHKQHEDLDQYSAEKVWDHQWDQFLTYYYSLVHDGCVFKINEDNETAGIPERCKVMVEQFEEHWPQLNLDGTNNIWILKPAAKSRGRGIQIMKKLEDIISKINSSQSKDSRYVAQKYIERPLLIYDTKFDIRQWFLVTCAFPLTVWIYKESYLRFCSQLFSLINTHESVHLSNNAVQCKYTNAKRDVNLPDENMWDCYTFKAYLRSKGKPEVWETVIYPGICQNIIGTLLACQDSMDQRKNCFELFGADFMLTENCTPWLIEINSGPSMSPSTSVTARMCAQVLDDVIKVVIDRKNNKNADTGMFELIYKQIIPPPQPYMGQNLIVRGTKIPATATSNSSKTPKTEVAVTTTATAAQKARIKSTTTRTEKQLIFIRNCFRERASSAIKNRIKLKSETEIKRKLAKKRNEHWCNNLWKTAGKENTWLGDSFKNKSNSHFPFLSETLKRKSSSSSYIGAPAAGRNEAVFPQIISSAKKTD